MNTTRHNRNTETESADERLTPPAARFGGDRRHLALWLAVGGTTAVIAVMWFLLLPMQLGDVRLPNARDLSRWSVKNDSGQEVRSFDENLRLIREKLTSLTQQEEQPSEQARQPVNIDLEELRYKLEAASLKNERISADEAKK